MTEISLRLLFPHLLLAGKNIHNTQQLEEMLSGTNTKWYTLWSSENTHPVMFDSKYRMQIRQRRKRDGKQAAAPRAKENL